MKTGKDDEFRSVISFNKLPNNDQSRAKKLYGA